MILKEFLAGFLPGKRDDVRFETEPGQQMKVDWVSSGKSRRSSASSAVDLTPADRERLMTLDADLERAWVGCQRNT